jgi:hypothetical protein
MSNEITHRHGMGGTQTGYKKDRCRCRACKEWNTTTRQKERRTIAAAGIRVRTSPVATASTDAVSVSPLVVREPISAQNQAMEDMTEILARLDSDPEWRSNVEEDMPGEITVLRSLIRDWNHAGGIPRIQYGFHEGRFWVGAADEPEEESSVSERSTNALSRRDVTDTRTVAVGQGSRAISGEAGMQLPWHAPLARPREVSAGRLPTVPAAPVRAASPASQRGDGNAVDPGDPVWG